MTIDGTTISADMVTTTTILYTAPEGVVLTADSSSQNSTGYIELTSPAGETERIKQGDFYTYQSENSDVPNTLGSFLSWAESSFDGIESAELTADGGFLLTLADGYSVSSAGLLVFGGEFIDPTTLDASDNSVAALAEAIQAEIDGEPAVHTISSNVALTASTPIGLYTATVTIGVESPVTLASGATTIDALLTLIEAVDGIASAVIDPENDARILVTSDAAGADASIQVSLQVNDGENSTNIITSTSDPAATGSDGTLTDTIGEVSVSGTEITFTAAEQVDGYGEINITEVAVSTPAVTQVTEIDLSDFTQGSDDFADQRISTDGDMAQVSVEVAGETITTEVGTDDADTIRELTQAIIEARDGVFETVAATAIEGETAAEVRIALADGVDGNSVVYGSGYNSSINVDISFTNASDETQFSTGDTSPLALGDFSMTVSEMVAALDAKLQQENPDSGAITYDAATNEIVITSADSGTDSAVVVNNFAVTEIYNNDVEVESVSVTEQEAVTGTDGPDDGSIIIDMPTAEYGVAGFTVLAGENDRALWQLGLSFTIESSPGTDVALRGEYNISDDGITLYANDISCGEINNITSVTAADIASYFNVALTAYENSHGLSLGSISYADGGIKITPVEGTDVALNNEFGEGDVAVNIFYQSGETQHTDALNAAGGIVGVPDGTDLSLITSADTVAQATIELGSEVGAPDVDFVQTGDEVVMDIDFSVGSDTYNFSTTYEITANTTAADLAVALDAELSAYEATLDGGNGIELGTISWDCESDAAFTITSVATGSDASITVNEFTLPAIYDADSLALESALDAGVYQISDYVSSEQFSFTLSDTVAENFSAYSWVTDIGLDVAFEVEGGTDSFNASLASASSGYNDLAECIAVLNGQLTQFETENYEGANIADISYDASSKTINLVAADGVLIKTTSTSSEDVLFSIRYANGSETYGATAKNDGWTDTHVDVETIVFQSDIGGNAIALSAADALNADDLLDYATISATISVDDVDVAINFSPELAEEGVGSGGTVADFVSYLDGLTEINAALVDGAIVITPATEGATLSGELGFNIQTDAYVSQELMAEAVAAASGTDEDATDPENVIDATAAQITLGEFAGAHADALLAAGTYTVDLTVDGAQTPTTVSFTADGSEHTLADFVAEIAADESGVTAELTAEGIVITTVDTGAAATLEVGELSLTILSSPLTAVSSVLDTVDYDAAGSITLTAADTGDDPLAVEGVVYEVEDTETSVAQEVSIMLYGDNAVDAMTAGSEVRMSIAGQEFTYVVTAEDAASADTSGAIATNLLAALKAQLPELIAASSSVTTPFGDTQQINLIANQTGSDALGNINTGGFDIELLTNTGTVDSVQLVAIAAAAVNEEVAGELYFTETDGGDIYDESGEGSAAVTGRDGGVVSYDDGSSDGTVYDDYTLTINGEDATLSDMSEFAGLLDIDDEVTEGIAPGGIDDATVTNPSDDADYYGDTALTGTDGIDQDYDNPENDSDLYGDSALTGADGIDQDYANPEDDSDLYGDSALTGADGIDQDYDNPEDDSDLYGEEEGYYADDGLYTDDDEYVDATDKVDVDETDGTVEGELADDDSEEDGFSTDGNDGIAPYDWDESVVTTLSSGTAEADIIRNFQTGVDAIAMAGDLLTALGTGELSGMGMTPIMETVFTGYDDIYSSGTFTYDLGTDFDPDAELTVFYSYWHDSAGNWYGSSARDTENLNQYYNVANYDTYANLEAFEAAVNESYDGDEGTISFDFDASSGILTVSSAQSLNMAQSLRIMDEQPAGFDLSETGYGLVDSSDNDSVTVADLDNAEAIAGLLNDMFDFDADDVTGTSDNDELNASIFAVTASDDSSQTAIWAHEQSTTGDATVESSELSLLALVETIGGEFSISDFDDVVEHQPLV